MIICKKEYVMEMMMDRLNDAHNMIARIKTKSDDINEKEDVILMICSYIQPGP